VTHLTTEVPKKLRGTTIWWTKRTLLQIDRADGRRDKEPSEIAVLKRTAAVAPKNAPLTPTTDVAEKGMAAKSNEPT